MGIIDYIQLGPDVAVKKLIETFVMETGKSVFHYEDLDKWLIHRIAGIKTRKKEKTKMQTPKELKEQEIFEAEQMRFELDIEHGEAIIPPPDETKFFGSCYFCGSTFVPINTLGQCPDCFKIFKTKMEMEGRNPDPDLFRR